MMHPYRSHSPFNERRMRRMVRKQGRLDKRLLARSHQRYQRELAIQQAKDLCLLFGIFIMMASSVIAMVEFIR